MNQPLPRERFTAAIVRELVLSRLESEEPDAILAIFRADNGKPFTKRILAKLLGGEARWRIEQIANMTHVAEREATLPPALRIRELFSDRAFRERDVAKQLRVFRDIAPRLHSLRA